MGMVKLPKQIVSWLIQGEMLRERGRYQDKGQSKSNQAAAAYQIAKDYSGNREDRFPPRRDLSPRCRIAFFRQSAQKIRQYCRAIRSSNPRAQECVPFLDLRRLSSQLARTRVEPWTTPSCLRAANSGSRVPLTRTRMLKILREGQVPSHEHISEKPSLTPPLLNRFEILQHSRVLSR